MGSLSQFKESVRILIKELCKQLPFLVHSSVVLFLVFHLATCCSADTTTETTKPFPQNFGSATRVLFFYSALLRVVSLNKARSYLF